MRDLVSAMLKSLKEHFLWVDLAGTIVATLLLCVHSRIAGSDFLEKLLTGNRVQAYQMLAGLFGSMLGFVITAASVLLAVAGHENLALLRKSKHYPMLWQTYTSAMYALGCATILAVVGFFWDREDSPQWAYAYVVLGASLLSAIRVGWTVLFLGKVIKIVARTEPKKAADPEA